MWGPSDSAGVITGRVENFADGAPIAGESILLRGGPDWVKATRTGTDGAFRFAGVAEGRYVLRVGIIRHPPVRDSLTVHAGRGLTVRVRLEPSQVEMGCVTVSARHSHRRSENA
jgi:hypothetical protein